MPKLIGLILVCLAINTGLHAADDYAVSKIPANLLKNADVVKRMEEIRYEVIAYTKVRYYHKTVLTILNENGDRFAELNESYDPLRTIRSIEGKLYDITGSELKELKKKDIQDLSAVSGFMEDDRVKVFNFYHRVYPYTVEYEVVMEMNNTLAIPSWFPQPTQRYSVEKSSMVVAGPDWYTFRFKNFNYDAAPQIVSDKGGKVYTWQLSSKPAILFEYASPEWPLLTTCIYFTPVQFEMQGYKGSYNSWNEFGLFQKELNKERDKLPSSVRQKVHELTDAIPEVKEKIRILYEYLQKNTRYISIQLGIGGLQPFDATYVATKAYGDCKALSNYMYALLKEAGIRSCYTKIKAGAGQTFFMPDFPSFQSNHIILCVPLQKDTMWLECTSQTLPAGYLSDFTCDRYALLVDETGGHLVHTPKYGLLDNLQSRNIKAVLSQEGVLEMNARTRYKCMQQDDVHALINNLSKDKVKESLQEQLDFPTYEINHFEYKEEKTALPVIDEMLDITVSNYAAITGKRLFIVPNIMTRSGRKLLPDPDREHDILIRTEYLDTDTVEIELPQGYQQEAIPADVSINSQFGKYRSSVKLINNKLYYFRKMEYYSGRFAVSEYPELVKFYEAIYKADRAKVVLVKNETAPLKAF